MGHGIKREVYFVEPPNKLKSMESVFPDMPFPETSCRTLSLDALATMTFSE